MSKGVKFTVVCVPWGKDDRSQVSKGGESISSVVQGGEIKFGLSWGDVNTNIVDYRGVHLLNRIARCDSL